MTTTHFTYRLIYGSVVGKLVENRQHLEAATLLTDYANVITSCVCFTLLVNYLRQNRFNH